MRMQRVVVVGVAAMLVFTLVVGCDRPESTALAAGHALAPEAAQQASPKKLSVALCSPSQGGFTIQSTNPYFPLVPVGRRGSSPARRTATPSHCS